MQRWRVCVWLALASHFSSCQTVSLLFLAVSPTHTCSEGGRKAVLPRVWAHVMSGPHSNTNKHQIHKHLLQTRTKPASFQLQVSMLLLSWQTHTGALVQDHKSGWYPRPGDFFLLGGSLLHGHNDKHCVQVTASYLVLFYFSHRLLLGSLSNIRRVFLVLLWSSWSSDPLLAR